MTGPPRARWALPAAYRAAAGPTLLSTAASGVSAVTTLAIARQVGAAEFGGYALVVTVGGILLVVAVLNINAVMYQELPRRPRAEHPALLSTALAVALVLGLGVALGCALAAPALRAAFDVDAATLRYSVLFALTTGFAVLTESFLRGQSRFARVAGLKLALAVAYLAVSLWFLLALRITAFGSYVALLSAANTLFGVVALAGQPVRPGLVSLRLARRVLRHGAYLSGTTALLLVVLGLDLVVLNHVAAPDAVGAYSIYNGFPKRLLGILFTEGVGLVLLPVLATLPKPELLRRIGRIAPLLGLAAAACTAVAGVPVLGSLGDGYPSSPLLLSLAALGIAVHTVFNLYYFALTMDGTRGAKVVIVALLIALPPALVLQVALIAAAGLVGALVAFAATNALLVGAVLVVTTRVYPRVPAGSGAR